MPSAFYTPRHDQWDVLVQSAALDNLLYVVALNQYNEHFLDEAALLTPCGLIVSKVFGPGRHYVRHLGYELSADGQKPGADLPKQAAGTL